MKPKKASKALFIIAGVFIAIAVGLLITAYATNEMDGMGMFAIIVFVFAFLFLIIAAAQMAMEKKADKNMQNPQSLSYLTYGGHGDYVYFSATLNNQAENRKNAAVNAIGIVSMIFLGVGFFRYGQNFYDVFVSPNGLVLNSKRTNNALEDMKFTVIPSSSITRINMESLKRVQRIFIDTTSHSSTITLDIRVKNEADAERVRDAFANVRYGGNATQKEVGEEDIFDIPSWKYQLTINNNGYDQKVDNPTHADLENALGILAVSHENFVILESSSAVNNFTFIQATDLDASANTVWVEAQRKENVEGKTILRQYGKTVDTLALLDMLDAFTTGKTPDTTGWKHIQDIG